ncbi:MAG TPA: hypothetical protein DEG71_08965 [Clostridiales bacterium]|nr:hypothetical protein [Clostridiales bacterium]
MSNIVKVTGRGEVSNFDCEVDGLVDIIGRYEGNRSLLVNSQPQKVIQGLPQILAGGSNISTMRVMQELHEPMIVYNFCEPYVHAFDTKGAGLFLIGNGQIMYCENNGIFSKPGSDFYAHTLNGYDQLYTSITLDSILMEYADRGFGFWKESVTEVGLEKILNQSDKWNKLPAVVHKLSSAGRLEDANKQRKDNAKAIPPFREDGYQI